MSFLQQGSAAQVPQPVHFLRISDSQWGVPLPIIYGRARVPKHLLWYGDYKAVENTGPGKGLLGQSPGGVWYNYYASRVYAVCHGPITGFGRGYDASAGGLTRKSLQYIESVATLALGALGQAPWYHLVNAHPGQDIGYSGIATVSVGEGYLGMSPVLPQTSNEIFGFLPYSAVIPDADASAVIQDMISNAIYGMAPGATWIDSAVSFADLTNYVVANGFFISIAFDQQKPGREWLQTLFEAIYADAVWSEGQLRAVPYSTDPTVGNGVTWRPNLTAVCNFSDDDFRLTGPTDVELSIKVQDPLTRFNIVRIEFIDVFNDYNLETYEWMDEADMVVLNRRPAPVKQYHCIPSGSMASAVARLQLQKYLAVNRQYEFKVAPTKAALVDPMDVVSLSSLFYGLSDQLVRVVSTEEAGDPADDSQGRSDLEVTIICEDLNPSAQLSAIAAGTGGSSGTLSYVVNNDSVPPAAPILFSNDLLTYTAQTEAGVQLQAAGVTASAGELYWDGTVVISTQSYNPACIQTWDATNGWKTPLVLHDANSQLGGGGAGIGGVQPQNGPYAIDFDGTTYAVGGLDSLGNSCVYTSIDRATWTLVDLNNLADFNNVQILKWIKRFGVWIALPGDLYTSPAGAASWTNRVSDGFFVGWLYDDGTKVWTAATHLWSTVDGVTWVNEGTNSMPPWREVVYVSSLGLWVMIANNSNIYWATAPNATWSIGLTVSNTLCQLALIGSTLYAIELTASAGLTTGINLHKSTDGKTWTTTALTPPASIPITDVAFIDGLLGAPDGESLAISIRSTSGIGVQIAYLPSGSTTLQTQWSGGHFTSGSGATGSEFPPTQSGVGLGVIPIGSATTTDPDSTPLSVNPPIFVEPHTLVPSNPYTLWIALSGQAGLQPWGGSQIWMSADGGSTYTQIGQATNSAIMGVLEAPLPAHADPDTVDSLDVDLSESAGVVSSISTTLADQGFNLAWVDGEFISFANVAPGISAASGNAYSFALTYLRRGLYGTPIKAHATGAPFFFIYSGAFPLPGVSAVLYPSVDVGVELWFKFSSFNNLGGGALDLSGLTAYPYTPVGP